MLPKLKSNQNVNESGWSYYWESVNVNVCDAIHSIVVAVELQSVLNKRRQV